MRRLGGWERLLVVLSLAWLAFATISYFSALGKQPINMGAISKIVPYDAFHCHWIPDTSGSPNRFGDLPAIHICDFSLIGFGAFLLGPPIVACVFFWIVCWVRNGFHRT